jgi:hypothetical protein
MNSQTLRPTPSCKISFACEWRDTLCRVPLFRCSGGPDQLLTEDNKDNEGFILRFQSLLPSFPSVKIRFNDQLSTEDNEDNEDNKFSFYGLNLCFLRFLL